MSPEFSKYGHLESEEIIGMAFCEWETSNPRAFDYDSRFVDI